MEIYENPLTFDSNGGILLLGISTRWGRVLTAEVDRVDLDERKKMILGAIIESYIETAEPVGSRTIAKRNSLNISPATIRNEMADLEDMGLLEQPHTSAGRVPSHLGYRTYVDRLMKRYQLTAGEVSRMRSLMELKIAEIDTLIKEIANIYSRLTNYTVIGSMPDTEKATIKHFQIMPIDDDTLLLVIVTNANTVKDTKIGLEKPVSVHTAARISSLLNEKLAGVSCEDIDLETVTQLQAGLADNEELLQPILRFIYDCIETTENAEVFYGGITNLLSFPEYSNISRAKQLLEFLDDKANLHRAVALREHENVKIIIGSENKAAELVDCSIILSSYQINGEIVGTIGLIGPTRMNYSKAVSHIEYLTRQLNRLTRANTEEEE
ncbi:MAG: heat-inducible transcriptional repressor HrcA [Clostridiales bacterium]|nr:heat-inducible transcriptional repressor HrcA [Clostridiales bacterium]